MIVLGLGFGDEGKGLMTSYLCSKIENPLVVRFNGGHQAGHTVCEDNKRHVFSSYGSGTLQGVPTLISHYCTIFPTAIINEHKVLVEESNILDPVLYVHSECPVTTPYDVAINQKLEDDRGDSRHGSVGVGFGSTIQRHEDSLTLFARDLKYQSVVKAKLENISTYYGIKLPGHEVDSFLEDILETLDIIDIINYDDLYVIYRTIPNLIFEGAQGILLDQTYGFFPNVTRSNTTSKNAIDLARLIYRDDSYRPEIYYVTRSYQTRHGAGYMSDEQNLDLVNNENETNVSHEYQGNFRIGKLDIDLLNYAIECDNNFSDGLRKNLTITCLDQHHVVVDTLISQLDEFPHSVFTSNSPISKNIKLLNQSELISKINK